MILNIEFARRQIIVDVVMQTTLLLETRGLGEWLLLEAAIFLGRCNLILALCVVALLLRLIETEEILLFEIRRLLVKWFAGA